MKMFLHAAHCLQKIIWIFFPPYNICLSQLNHGYVGQIKMTWLSLGKDCGEV